LLGYFTDYLRSSLTVDMPAGQPWVQGYYIDGTHRFTLVSPPFGSFTSTYRGGSLLRTNLALPWGGAITNAFDTLGRLTGTWLKNTNGTILNSHTYAYNLADQRTNSTRNAAQYWSYLYDAMGQLTNASGFEPGGSARLHETFRYGYDRVGNLNVRTNNALVQTFGVNSLNELTSASSAGTLTVAGNTTTAATSVTVNGSSATRYSDNAFALTGQPVTSSYTAVAVDSLGRSDTNTITPNLSSSVTFQYDVNGNLTGDGRRILGYDEESQLTSVTVTNGVGNSTKSEFSYDGLGRMRVRKEWVWQTSSFVQQQEVRYIYEGRQVVQERDGLNLPQVTYVRGTDLSGSLAAAGGIGGLLARYDHLSGTAAYYHADGNGND
jgi:hypothetical protein